MLDRRSPDQKMPKSRISRQSRKLFLSTQNNCFLFNFFIASFLLRQCLALTTEQQNLYQKHLIADLLQNSNSLVKQTQTVNSPSSERRQFDIKFKGRNALSHRRGGLTIKFKPSLKGVSVTSYGTCLDDSFCKDTELTDENGSVFITKFKPETDLCFVARANGKSHLVWWQQCVSTPSLERKTEISINLENTEVQPQKLKLLGTDPDGTSLFPVVPLDGVQVDLHLSKPVGVGQFPSHSDSTTLTSDVNGDVLILTNTHLSGTAIIKEQSDYESFSSNLSFDPEDKSNNEHFLRLSANCPEHLNQETSFNGLSTWTEMLGLGSKPLTQEEAIAFGWKSKNEKCNESDKFPGYRFENSESDSDHFLVLVFDASGVLCGAQVALPKSLANPQFNYKDNPYYIEGEYDGESAYFISTYFVDPVDVCRQKTSLELICSDGLGGNDEEVAFVISKYKQSQIYLDENEAKTNGWSVQQSNTDREVYLSPPNDAPYFAIYRDEKLVGLTLMHSSHIQKRHTLQNTIYEPANQMKLFAESFSSQQKAKYDQEGTLMANFYMGDDDKVHVYLTLRLGGDGHYYPRKYYYWSDAGDRGERGEHEGKIERFRVKKSAKHIYIFGYYESSSTVHYAIVKVDPCRGNHDVHATIHRGEQSKLEVIERQSDRGLSGSIVKLEVGVASMHAMEARLKLGGQATVYLDTPKGLLVAWSVEGPKHQAHMPHPDRSHSIAPFHQKSHLLKTINFDLHVCLENPDGKDLDGSEKEAVVEVSLEYEWASQDDSKEIIPVDYRGHVYLKNVPSPLPGENLNVTLISKIDRQHFFGSRTDFHRPIAIHSQTVKYHEDGPVKISFCHQREQVAVVVSNGVTSYRMSGIKVQLSPDNSDEILDDVTDHEGATFFSFKDASSFEVIIEEKGFDSVRVTKNVDDDLQTQVVHIELYPQQIVRVEVALDDEDETPAIGATVEYVFDDGTHGFGGVDGQGVFDLIVPGSSASIVKLTASLPWQSTCGVGKEENGEETKNVFGIVTMSSQDFPLVTRDVNTIVTQHIVLPRISKVDFQIGLDGTFPDVAVLSSNVMAMKDLTVHVEDKILHDQVSVYVETGARTAHLFSVEWYNNNIILTPLNPCIEVNSETVEESGDQILLKQSIYRDTVKVTLKTVDQDYASISNVTIEYILGETEFESQSLEVSEEGEMFFHLPHGLLVSIEPKSQYTPDPSNPKYFVAKQDLEVVLVFDTKNSVSVIVELIGEDFTVPEDTLVRYLAVDDEGEVISSEALFSDSESRVYFKTRRNVQYIEFSIAGSDGFDPVFYQPFDYVYNVTNPYWSPPLTIEIPVKTLKNVIVAVRDCFTGESITEAATVTVPEDAPRWNSWFNQDTMSSRHEGQPDDQGLVFFNLEPDQLVPVRVSVKGYKDFEDKINIKSNVTYLVEANMCRDITITLKLVDASNGNSPIKHATVRIGVDGEMSTIEVTTNEAGKATFDISTKVRRLTLQLIDAPEDVKEPIFELHDEAPNFLKDADVDITVLERMHTVKLSTSSCNGDSTYADVPVLVSICYDDESGSCKFKDPGHRFFQINNDENNDKRRQFIVTSASNGDVVFQVFESAKTIVAKILEPPPKNPKAVNVGLLPKRDLPKRFDFNFYNLPKEIVVSVRDSREERLSGAEVNFIFFDPSIGKDQTQVSITDQIGRAEITVDGCVELMTFEVNPPSEGGNGGHQCFMGGKNHMGWHQSAKTSNWNVRKDQKFKINLERSKDHSSRKVRLSVRSGVNRPDEVRVTTDVDLASPIQLNRQQDPFFNSWHLEIPSNARRAFLIETDRTGSTMGFVDVSLCCTSVVNGRTISVEGFTGSVEMSVEVVNGHGEPVHDARVVWHLGHGLGTAWVPIDSRGQATLWAPPGEPLFLRPVGSVCGQEQDVVIVDAHAGHKITLKCTR